MQVGYVYCEHTSRYADSGGGWRPDPLLPPLPDGSIFLEAMLTQPIWLTITVPPGSPAGTYRGEYTLEVGVAGVGSVRQQLPVELTVWDLSLPRLSEARFPAVFSFNPAELRPVYGDTSPLLQQQFYQLLLSQRVGGDNLYTTTPTNLSTASFLAGAGVQWISLYDVYGAAGLTSATQGVGRAQVGGAKPEVGGAKSVKDRGVSRVGGACLNFTEALVEKVVDTLAPTVAAYQAKGILDKAFVYGFDEVAATCEPSLRRVYSAVKARWPRLRTMAVLNWLPAPDLPLDAWVLQYELFNASAAAVWTGAGHQQWWYHCIEPSGVAFLNSFIERPLLETRLLFWLGASCNASGWLYYSTVMWRRHPPSSAPLSRLNGTARTDFSPANYIWLPRTDIFANGDGNFVYPGPEGPLASARLHNLRDGFEDAELFRLLPLEQVSGFTGPLVRGPTDFSLDAALLERQRQAAAAAASLDTR